MRNKLLIFKIVAYHASFTKAAEQLYISQPAVSKAIRNLEDEYKRTFFLRKRSSIELTEDGKAFLVYVDRILSIFAEMEEQFINQKEALPTAISFGVSTTLANYIIPKIIANFRLQYPKINFEIKSGNSEEIENLILNQQLDFGITEGNNTNRKLQFKKFIKDEIVLVTNANNVSIKNDTIDIKTLSTLPFIERESGSGTREMIYEFLKKSKIKKLNTVVTLNSTEAIKHFLYYSNSYALVSIHAVNEDLIHNKLKIIDIKNLSIERWFYFVSRTGYQSKVMDLFQKFCRA
ncbi:MAG: LysR family transcriptional regulator [Cyclobacteriaceae bacterium]|nr:LysR family transcriptional regulator [Cyclobacteriaceae bacterium]